MASRDHDRAQMDDRLLSPPLRLPNSRHRSDVSRPVLLGGDMLDEGGSFSHWYMDKAHPYFKVDLAPVPIVENFTPSTCSGPAQTVGLPLEGSCKADVPR